MRRYIQVKDPLLTAGFLLWFVLWPLLIFPESESALTLIAAACLSVTVLLIIRRQGLKPPGIISGLLLVYLALSIISFFNSPIPEFSLRRLTALLAGATGYFLVRTWLKNDPLEDGPDRIHVFAAGLAIAGGFVSIGSLFVIDWPARYLIDIQGVSEQFPHLSGDFYLNNNALAGILLLLLPIALAFYLKITSRLRFFFLISAICMVVVLILTQSRGAFLGAIVAILAWILWGRMRFAYVMVFLVLLLLLPFVVTGFSDIIEERGNELISTFDRESKGGPSQDQSWLARLEIWQNASRTMSDYPVIGAGLYTFVPVSRMNYVYEEVLPNFDISHAHNLFLHTGASLGWAGWLMAAALWVSVLYALWQSSSTSSERESWLPRALTAGTAGFIVFNSFDVLAPEQRVGIIVWLFLALVSGVIDFAGFKGRRLRWIWLAPIGLFVILLITPMRSTNLARTRLDRARLSGEDLVSADATEQEALRADYRRLGLVRYLSGDKEAALLSWKSDPEAGRFLFNQGQQASENSLSPEEAIDWYSLSISIDDESGESYFWRGEALMELGESQRALEDYQLAAQYGYESYYYSVRLDAMAWARLGQLYLEQDKLPESIHAFTEALSIEPDFNDFRQQLKDIEKLFEQRRLTP